MMIIPNQGKYPFLVRLNPRLSVHSLWGVPLVLAAGSLWNQQRCFTSLAYTVITAFMTVFLCSLSLLCCAPSLCPFLCTTLLRTDIPQLNLASPASRPSALERLQWWNLKSCSLTNYCLFNCFLHSALPIRKTTLCVYVSVCSVKPLQ